MGNIKLEGLASDCLYVSGNVKTIRLINIDENSNSNFSLEIVSESENGDHELIDSLIGKKISIEVKILE